MIVIGIDQGLSGAVAVVTANAQTIYPTPIVKGKKRKQFDEVGMLGLLSEIQQRHVWPQYTNSSSVCAFIETVQPMPLAVKGSINNQVRIAISQGLGDGLWRMALTACRIAYTQVNPRKWQNVMLAGVAGDDTKQRSIIAAKRLCPGVSLRHSERCTVDNHNWSDALLIALYGQRTLGGNGR